MTANNNDYTPAGPGLFAVETRTGTVITNIRRLAGADRAPGSVLIAAAGWLLAALGAGLLFVSFAGQYTYLFRARHQHVASMIEAAMLDVGMVIFSLLALGLARAGKPARTERALIMACSFGSAGMAYSAADTASPRSVVAYVAAPVFLAIVVDRVIAVIRRHVQADDETSAWTALGRAAVAAVRFVGQVLLYSLRTVLAPGETARGLRQMVLEAAPIPGLTVVPATGTPQPPDDPYFCTAHQWRSVTSPCPDCLEEPPANGGPTKKARLLGLYRAHRDYGNRAVASQVAAELAPFADLQAGTARTYIYDEIDRHRGAIGGAQ